MPFGGVPLPCSEIRRSKVEISMPFSSQNLRETLEKYLNEKEYEYDLVSSQCQFFGWMRGKITGYEKKKDRIENIIFPLLEKLSTASVESDKKKLADALKDIAHEQVSLRLSLILEQHYFRLTDKGYAATADFKLKTSCSSLRPCTA